MSLYSDLKKLRAERLKIADQAGAILTKATLEGRKLTAEESQEWDRRMADVDDRGALIRRLEKQLDTENQMSAIPPDRRISGMEDWSGSPGGGYEQRSPGGAGTGGGFGGGYLPSFEQQRSSYAERHNSEEDKEFRHYLMTGHADPRRMALLSSAEQRALSTVTGALGGYTVPQDFQYELEVGLKYFGGMMTYSEVINTDKGEILPYPSINDTSNTGEVTTENSGVGGSGDGGAAAELDPTYGAVQLNAWMFDSGIVLVPIQLMQDSAFNIEGYLVEQLGIRVGRKMNTLFTIGSGSGSSQPQGILGVVPTGAETSTETSLTYDDILNLEHSVDPAYRQSRTCAFMFNDQVLKAVRQLTDNNGRPLWIAGGVSEGIVNKMPDRLDGYPYVINQDMPGLGQANQIMLFGDLRKYKVRLVRGSQLLRLGERYMDKLQIGFLNFQRADGNLVDPGTGPIKCLQNSTS